MNKACKERGDLTMKIFYLNLILIPFLSVLSTISFAQSSQGGTIIFNNKDAEVEKLGTCESAAQDGILMFETSEVAGIVTLKEQLFLYHSNIYLLRNQVVYTELDGIKSIVVTCSKLKN